MGIDPCAEFGLSAKLKSSNQRIDYMRKTEIPDQKYPRCQQ